MRFSFPMEMEGAAEVQKMLSSMFGEGGIETYYGISGEYIIQSTGGAAEERFRAMVDRVTAKKRKRAKMTGLTPEMFAPMQTGPGFFVSMDFGRFLTDIMDVIPVEGQEAKEVQEIRDFFASLPEGAGRVVAGARFEPDSVHAGGAVSLDLIKAIGELVAKAEAEAAKEQEQEQAEPAEPTDAEKEITSG
jgi:hypothetical protein